MFALLSKSKWLCLCSTLVLSMLLGMSQGWAQTGEDSDDCLSDEKCLQLCDQARVLSRAGQYEGALFAYQMAFGMHPKMWLLVNIGRMQQKSGRNQQAVATYRRFLEETATREGAPPPSQDLIDLRVKVRQYLLDIESPIDPSIEPEPTHSVVSTESVTPAAPTPIYRKWWFGASIAGAVTAVALSIGIGVALSRGPKTPSTDGLSVFTATF
jgi:tetratricopeptide (TPR) repeat protein